jgi:hypothetical protein
VTSVCTREDLEASLWKVCGRIGYPEIQRLMTAIDGYALAQARKLMQTGADPYAFLKAGETDPASGMRRCRRCGDVKRLEAFRKDTKQPMGHRLTCSACSEKGKLP